MAKKPKKGTKTESKTGKSRKIEPVDTPLMEEDNRYRDEEQNRFSDDDDFRRPNDDDDY